MVTGEALVELLTMKVRLSWSQGRLRHRARENEGRGFIEGRCCVYLVV